VPSGVVVYSLTSYVTRDIVRNVGVVHRAAPAVSALIVRRSFIELGAADARACTSSLSSFLSSPGQPARVELGRRHVFTLFLGKRDEKFAANRGGAPQWPRIRFGAFFQDFLKHRCKLAILTFKIRAVLAISRET